MSADIERSILDALSIATGVPVMALSAAAVDVQRAVLAASADPATGVVHVEHSSRHFLSNRDLGWPAEPVVVGPFATTAEADPSDPVLDSAAIERLSRSLKAMSESLRLTVDLEHRRLELAGQLEVIDRSVLAVTSELELNMVLRRIVDLARELARSRYAALGVPDGQGGLAEFLTSGLTDEQERHIGALPRGLGLLGLLLREPRTIRLADLSRHPASAGFPAHHPPMTSFLGVPIISHGKVLGNLYLTEKIGAREFSETDARLVELLARHAGVAIENAELYRELQERERQLKVVLDQLPEAVLFFEASPHRVSLVNQQAQRLIGFEFETPLDLQVFAEHFVLRDQRGRPIPLDQRPMFRSLLRGEVVIRQEIRYRQPDGRDTTYLVNSVPLLNDDRVVAAVVVFQDITAIKDADQLKDDFLSLVSHELRTPLTTIHGGTQMLMSGSGVLDEADRMQMLRDMHDESSRLATLIQNMVQLAHVQAGRLQLETEPVLIRKLIDTCVSAFQEQATDREFRVMLQPGLVVIADPGSVDDILRNLIQNAIKYTPDGTPIDVGARAAGEAVEIFVRDYGSGVPEEEMAILFERFRRGSRAQGGRSAGMGLGLYLVRHLVEANQGQIRIQRPPDAGMEVVFTLPMISEA